MITNPFYFFLLLYSLLNDGISVKPSKHKGPTSQKETGSSSINISFGNKLK